MFVSLYLFRLRYAGVKQK